MKPEEKTRQFIFMINEAIEAKEYEFLSTVKNQLKIATQQKFTHFLDVKFLKIIEEKTVGLPV
ncbi:MAG: hypothetical protein ACOCUL_01870 [Bacteroidota bacterium]